MSNYQPDHRFSLKKSGPWTGKRATAAAIAHVTGLKRKMLAVNALS
jgi:hypothetical protein